MLTQVDAVAIFAAAKRYNVPVFSSSSLRYSEGAQALRAGKLGDIYGCDAYGPCALEKTHPDLFWYGIHGVETLFTVMGSGKPPVTAEETLQIYAFMEAADQSKRQGGVPVTIESVMKTARKEAAAKLR